MLVATGLSACGGAGASDDSFCDQVEERAPGLFRNPTDLTVDPAIIGDLREIHDAAPESLRDDFEVLSEADDQEDLLAALEEIQAHVGTECGIDTAK